MSAQPPLAVMADACCWSSSASLLATRFRLTSVCPPTTPTGVLASFRLPVVQPQEVWDVVTLDALEGHDELLEETAEFAGNEPSSLHQSECDGTGGPPRRCLR